MTRRTISTSVTILLAAALFGALSTNAHAAPSFAGNWQITVTYPDGPVSDGNVTHILTMNVSPIASGSLVGRMVITDDQGNTYGGVWRQVGKKISITFELPCDQSRPNACGSMLLLGKFKPAACKLVGQKLVVLWDKADSQNKALYDTSNGSFSGIMLAQ